MTVSVHVAVAPEHVPIDPWWRTRRAASAVTSVVGVPDANRAADAVRPAAGSVARLASQKRTVSGTAQILYFTDAASFAQLQRQGVTAGQPDAVAGVNVASSLSGAQLGDTLTALDGEGRPVTMHVVAVLRDSLFEGVFIDWNEITWRTHPLT